LDLVRYISRSGNLKRYPFPVCHHPAQQSLDFLLIYEYTFLFHIKNSHSANHMAGKTTTIPILRTKLQRPPIVGDHVKILSDGIRELKKSGEMKRIYESYGIEWQE